MTVEDFGRRLRAGHTSSSETTDACLRQIDADNPRLNAFILVMADEARRAAREADADLAAGRDHGPLHGVPISVKDLFDVKGVPTTAASRVRDGHMAAADAHAITLLRHAGAVILGKTNLHEFAFGTTNEDSAYGPARNPRDPSRSPGGSSGGSAVSVATGMALASLGTDTGASIRVPAAACGIVGLKPTYGEVPLDGVVPLSTTFDHAGPLAQTVTDAWHVYHALIGKPASRPLTPVPVAGLRIGVLRAYFCDVLDDDVRARFEAALETLRGQGATIEDVALTHASLISSAYLLVSFGDAAAYHASMLDAAPERYTVPVRQRAETARYVLAEDYVRGLNARNALTREVDAALLGYDALALPTLPIPAPPLGATAVDIRGEQQPIRPLMLKLTQLFNMTGHPAIALPCGNTASGLPCSLQLVGTRMQTEALSRVALTVEKVLHESNHG
ncbi:MAG TPA: amidase [Vicinamibacterales bacterium]|nr:amidase [Vicinamibacterales bacterium]